MREIGPHKYKSYITPPNYNDGEHWLSATDYSEKVKVMLENEPKKEEYIGALERNLQEELMNAELLEERVMVRRELNELNKIKKNK
tara:strand:- start:716 stop:973 length:258 start_codon:yes stop_codon:yes gene_type:complete